MELKFGVFRSPTIVSSLTFVITQTFLVVSNLTLLRLPPSELIDSGCQVLALVRGPSVQECITVGVDILPPEQRAFSRGWAVGEDNVPHPRSRTLLPVTLPTSLTPLKALKVWKWPFNYSWYHLSIHLQRLFFRLEIYTVPLHSHIQAP